MSRESMLEDLAAAIDGVECDHPLRVGIDGVGVSGKTVLADELAGPLKARGRSVIRASVDGFHKPSAARYRRGELSPEGYFHDSFDLGALQRFLLRPLGPQGSLRYRTAAFDFRVDAPVESPELVADARSVLLFEGVFILRPELRDNWEFTIFVEAGFDATLSRALSRDVELFGSEEEVRRRYERRYIPGERLYLETCSPREFADVVVRNDDPPNAVLEWRAPARRCAAA